MCGVQVYDTNAHQLIGSLSRPKGGAHAACRRCSLYLHEGSTLYIAWADAVRVVKIEARHDGTGSTGGAAAGSMAGAGTGTVGALVGAAGLRYQLVTVSDFSTTYLCLVSVLVCFFTALQPSCATLRLYARRGGNMLACIHAPESAAPTS